jgi:hypothetical protein
MEKSVKAVQKLHGVGIYCDSKLLDARMCIRFRKRENEDGICRNYMLYDRRWKIL